MTLFIHDDAKSDLDSISMADKQAAVDIFLLLQEFGTDLDRLDRLTQHGYGGDSRHADFNVSKWIEQWNKGRDLWRVKFWDHPKYRIVYAVIPSSLTHYILAVVDRSNFDYEPTSALTSRILRAYEAILDS